MFLFAVWPACFSVACSCSRRLTAAWCLIQERRPEFNIFVYGNTIIHKLEELTGVFKFCLLYNFPITVHS